MADDDTDPIPSPPRQTVSVDAGVQSTASANDVALNVRATPRKPPARLGRFVILDPLGAGGMGSVYSAWDRQLQRRVAIKILHRDDSERFLREAQALARLSHPNVVTVYDVESVDGVDFIAMELIEGMSLRRWLLERRRPWREILQAFFDAGSGLAAVHAMGLVHRDFKPDNVLVGNDGMVRIADFGLARSINTSDPTPDPRVKPSELLSASVTAAGAMIGTPRYMPPEQRGGGQADARADQYSFSMSLWEALFRRCPDDDTDWFPGAAGAVPGQLKRVLERGFAPLPEDRFASLKELMAGLREVTAPARYGVAIAAVAATLAVIAATQVWRRASTDRIDACQGEGDFTSAWQASDGAAVRAAFVATGAPGADAAADHAVDALDGYAAAVGAMDGEACHTARVRHLQSPAVLELRDTCLRRHFSEMRSLGAELRHPDAELVRKASVAVGALPAVSECADVDALSAPMTIPPNPAQRAPVAELHTEFDAIDAALLAGHYQEALPRAKSALERARALGFRPLVVDALLIVGRTETRLEELHAAESAYSEAVDSAHAAGHDAAMARAATRLVYLISYDGDGRRLDEARRSGRLAAATIERFAATRAVDSEAVVKLRAQLAEVMVDLEGIAGHLAEAETQARLALDLYARADARHTTPALHALASILHQRGHGLEGEQLARWSLALDTEQHAPPDDLAADLQLIAATEIDLNRLPDARKDYQRAADLAAATLGPDSLSVAASYEGEGIVDHNLGDWSGALDDYTKMQAIYEKHFGADSPKLARLYIHQGAALSALKRSKEARAALAHALAIDEKAAPDSMDVAKVLTQLAWRDADEQHYKDAIPEAERAVAIAEAINPGGFEIIDMINTAAFAYALQPAKALPLHQRALAKSEALYGKDSPQVSAALVGLAQDQIGLKLHAEATASLERALAIAPDKPERGARILLAQLYLEHDKSKRDVIRQLLERALADGQRDGDQESIHDATELLAGLK